MAGQMRYQRGLGRMPFHPREKLYSRADLSGRGWTRTMMDNHLPEPDDYRDNPHYTHAAAPMAFWLKTTIRKVERRKAVKEAFAARPRMSRKRRAEWRKIDEIRARRAGD